MIIKLYIMLNFSTHHLMSKTYQFNVWKEFVIFFLKLKKSLHCLYTSPFQFASSDHFLRLESWSGQLCEATRATRQDVTQIQPVPAIFCFFLNSFRISGQFICRKEPNVTCTNYKWPLNSHDTPKDAFTLPSIWQEQCWWN